MKYKTDIYRLRDEGKSYREIESELGCSRSLISYYLQPLGKVKTILRTRKNRLKKKLENPDLSYDDRATLLMQKYFTAKGQATWKKPHKRRRS